MAAAASRGEYFQRRQAKLSNQFSALGQPQQSSLFRDVVVAVDGYTPELSALEIKQIMSEHGGGYAVNVWASGVTHLICSHLPTAKIKTELKKQRRSVNVITARWIVDSLEAGRQLPVDKYVISQLRQTSLESWYANPATTTTTTTTVPTEDVLFKLMEDPVVLDACCRLKIDLAGTLVVVVLPRTHQLCAGSSQTKHYLPAEQLVLGTECRIQDGFVRRVELAARDGERTCRIMQGVMEAHCKAFTVLSSTDCAVLGPVAPDKQSAIQQALEQACGCAVECKRVPDWKAHKASRFEHESWRRSDPVDSPPPVTVGRDPVSIQVLYSIQTPVYQQLYARLMSKPLSRLATCEHVVLETEHGQTVSGEVSGNDAWESELQRLCSGLTELIPGEWVRAKLLFPQLEDGAKEEEDRQAFPESFGEVDLSVFYQLPMDIRNSIQMELQGAEEEDGDGDTRHSFPQTYSQVDPAVLSELPQELARQLESEFKSQQVTSVAFPHQPFSEIRQHVVAWLEQQQQAKVCPLVDVVHTCTRYLCECLLPSRELASVVALLSLLTRMCRNASCALHPHSSCWPASALRITQQVSDKVEETLHTRLALLA